MSRTIISHLEGLLFVAMALLGCGKEHSKSSVAADSESRAACRRIESLATSSPHKALEMVDSSLDAGIISPFRAKVLQAKIYYNPLQEDDKVIECATQALSMDTPELDDHGRIVLLRILSQSYYFSGEFDASIRCALEGEKAAEAIDSAAALAEFRFQAGECMLQLGQYASGYANMDYGISVMSRQKGCHQQMTLSHMLGEEMNFLADAGRLDEALETGRKREALLEETSKRNCCPAFNDQQLAYLYSKMAEVYMLAGDKETADEYCRKFYTTSYSKDPVGKLRILEYLLSSGQAGKALEIIGDTDFPTPGDTVSQSGSYYLKLKSRALGMLGDYKGAYDLLERSCAISDLVSGKVDSEKAMKAFNTHRKHEEELKDKEDEARRTKLLMAMALVFTACVILAMTSLLFFHKARNLTEKNRLISMGKSDNEKYMRLLRSAQEKIKELSHNEGDLLDRTTEADSWQLFLKLEDAMDKQKLYLDKGITRADILDLLGISKNRLGKMFQDIGGDLSLPSYINGKRLTHALGVIAEHPEYTVNEIADASGFANTRNFHLLFKKRFGITPLQYRNGK